MKLTFGISDKPKLPQLIVFAIQQLLAIMAATLVVPIIIEGATGIPLSPAAALFGAGIGTLVYIFFTKGKSPVFLGSSFAFINSMIAATAGVTTVALGYLGLVLGAIMAGLVYVVIAIVVKFAGVNWLNKLMPTVVIGPTVAIIGLSLAGTAIGDTQAGEVYADGVAVASPLICIFIAVITLIAITVASTYGKKMAKLIPFIIGIGCGYAVAAIFTVIGNVAGIDALKVIDFSYFSALLPDGKVALSTFFTVPQFIGFKALGAFGGLNGAYLGTLAAAYIPVAFVVFAEHIADHKNISSIIEKDLLEDPGLSRTLLGDGVGSIAGAFFGACPNTTYGESVACVAITGNASVATIFATAIGAILISFLSPFVAIVNSIPPCVMGGVCIALYGFIAVSGLKMIQKVDLEENRNLFVVSTILICGIGGLTLNFGQITITSIATALILGIIVNTVLSRKEKN